MQKGIRPLDPVLRNIVKDARGYLPKAVVPGVVAMLSTMIFTRIFLPDMYGRLSLVNAIGAPVLAVVAQIGGQPAGRFYNQYRNTSQEGDYRTAVGLFGVGAVLVLATLGSVTGAILLWTGLPHSLSWALVLGMIVSTMVGSLVAIFLPLLSASFQISAARYVAIGSAVGSLGLALMFIWVGGPRVSFILWASILVNCSTLPYIFSRLGFSRDDFRILLLYRVRSSKMVREFMNYGLPMALWFLASAVMTAGDRYILAIYHGVAAVGLYSTGYNTVNQGVQMVSAPLLTATWPRIIDQWTKGNVENSKIILRGTTNLYLVVGGYLVGGVAVLGPPLFRMLVGVKFASAYSILLPVAAGTVLWQMAHLGHASLELLNRTRVMARNLYLAVFFNFLANVCLVPRYGINGAALAILASYTVYVSLVWWTSRTALPWTIDILKLLEVCCATAIGLFVGKMLTLHALGTIGLVAGSGVGYSISYFLVILACNRLGRRFNGLSLDRRREL